MGEYTSNSGSLLEICESCSAHFWGVHVRLLISKEKSCVQYVSEHHLDFKIYILLIMIGESSSNDKSSLPSIIIIKRRRTKIGQ